jgi:ubiquinone/menaquinone biosynthesis C-methylase UbiE
MTGDGQVAAYAAADLREINQPALAHFKKQFPWFSGGRLLDLGSGASDVSIRFANAYPELRVLAVDGSENMLRSARELVRAAGLAERITLARHYLPDEGLPQHAFDAIVSNSLLHHMDDPLDLWRTIRRCAKRWAPVMVMDLWRPADVEAASALVARYAADAVPVLRQDFFHSLCAAYTPDEIREQLRRVEFNEFQVAEVDDLHVMAWGIVS